MALHFIEEYKSQNESLTQYLILKNKYITDLNAELTYWKETAEHYQNKLKEIQKTLNKTLDN